MSPIHRRLVEESIDWQLVECRRSKYPAIGRAYGLKMLVSGSARPPYYCHYMAWRLGTWRSEALFVRIAELLGVAESLPNWEHERQLLFSCEFADFWSLMWQMQVAEYLTMVGSDVRWAESGPDLSVLVDGRRWYVECYAPRKSFGLLEFVEELLGHVDPDLRAHYDLCMPFQLPRESERNGFIDSIFGSSLTAEKIAGAKNVAKAKSPVILYADPSSSLKVYLEGDDGNAYTPGVIPSTVGSPEGYLRVALKEVLSHKENSNSLEKHRPNIVAVNYLLSRDYQLATSLRRTASTFFQGDLPPAINALAICVVGIDQRLTKEEFRIVHGSHRGLSRIGELDGIAEPSVSSNIQAAAQPARA